MLARDMRNGFCGDASLSFDSFDFASVDESGNIVFIDTPGAVSAISFASSLESTLFSLTPLVCIRILVGP